jgi:hypothetical protein
VSDLSLILAGIVRCNSHGLSSTMVQISRQSDHPKASNLSKYLDFASSDDYGVDIPCLQTLSEETEAESTCHHLDETLAEQIEALNLQQTNRQQKSNTALAACLNNSRDQGLAEFSRSKQLLEEALFERHVDDYELHGGQGLNETLAELQQLPSFDRSSVLDETLLPVEQPGDDQSVDKDEFAGTLGPMYESYRSALPSQTPEILFFINHDGNCHLLTDCLNELALALYQCPEPTCQAVLGLGVMSSLRKRLDRNDHEQNIQALRVVHGYCGVMKSGKDVPHLMEHAIATSRHFPSNHTIAHLTIRILRRTLPTASAQEWFPVCVTIKAITHAAEVIEQWKTDLRLQQNAVEFLMEATRFRLVTQATFERAGATTSLRCHIARLTNRKGYAFKDSTKTLEAILSLPRSY